MKKIICAMLALGAAHVAAADDNSLSLLITKAKIESESLDNGFKLQFRSPLNDIVSLELAHGKYGELTSSEYFSDVGTVRYTAEVSATNFGLVLSPKSDSSAVFFGKIGMSSWKLDVDVSGYGSGNDDGTDMYYGFGLSAHPSSKVLFTLEYEILNLDDADVKSLNLGLGVVF